MNDIIEKLSPLEIKIIPYLKESLEKIKEKTGLDQTAVVHALKFLEKKGVVKLQTSKNRIIILGTNGIYYKRNHLPERKLLIALEGKNHCSFDQSQQNARLTDNEFKVSLGVLKRKALIIIKNGKISLNASREDLAKKMPEELLIEKLPLEEKALSSDQRVVYEVLKKRKDIIEIQEQTTTNFELTDLGRQLAGKEIKSALLEEVTSEIIKTWSKNKKFREYDIHASVPKITGGRRHFVNQAIQRARRIWLDLGFKEITGPLVDTSFWVFDALFTPQDHPSREMQDTFFIKNTLGKLPERTLVNAVRQAHIEGVDNSKGWNTLWNEKEAARCVLRTHTTSLSTHTIASRNERIRGKYFAIGKVFRNETIDWNHGFEFYQTEGIVIDENANLRHLFGYLAEFYKNMGYTTIRFRPSFFAYTEPSVEIEAFHHEKKRWIELGGAGIFRPEVVIPLLGEKIPILAWGQGFDRIIMEQYGIQDLREMYENDIEKLRNISKDKRWR